MTGCGEATAIVQGQRGVALSGDEPHRAKPAHADFRDAQSRFDAAALLRARVDQGFPERPAGDAEVQYCGVAAERRRQPGRAPIDAQGLDIAQCSAS